LLGISNGFGCYLRFLLMKTGLRPASERAFDGSFFGSGIRA
jgi:hypothetical protein